MSNTVDTAELDAPAEDMTEPQDITEPDQSESGGANSGSTRKKKKENSQTRPEGAPAPEAIVEAVLFATDSPLKPGKIAEIAEISGIKAIRKHIADLNERYESLQAPYRIKEIAEGYQMLTLPEFNPWLSKLARVRQETRLSQAAMETLAIVAYKQPILRADVEAIRGVACGEMLNRLRELNLIRIAGRAEDVGRPMLYGTTKQFLEVFGLGSLEDLPEIEALKPPE